MRKKDSSDNRINDPDLTEDIKKIQHLFEITPSDEVMDQLLNNGLESAIAIIRLSEDDFVKSYAGKLSGEVEAKEIWDWAKRLTDNNAKNVAMQLRYIARYDDNELSKEELHKLVELLCKDKRLLRSFMIHFAMKEGKA